MKHLILGTAGHIDHGKTSLVRRLTGIDTDRLPEEKKRGITIDLGFANLDLEGVRFGIVDVPGHERFIHNMVAGATGVDAVLLVVAADDSVMPQTVEHLAILNLLGIRTGLVAIAKSDLVDSEHLEMVQDEVRELLAGTFLEGAPMVGVSSTTGSGLDLLRERLRQLADGITPRAIQSYFRMPVDRAFSIAGHGAVVTGTILGGVVEVGDTVAVLPTNAIARVRGVQSHAAKLERALAGQRTAINLAGIRHDELRRGYEIAVPGYLTPTRRLLVEMNMLAKTPRPLKNRALVRLHIGTAEVTARAIVKSGIVEPGETQVIEFRAAEEVIADYGQRFIVRQLSPAATIGGGRVLDPNFAPAIRSASAVELGAKLATTDPSQRLASYLETHDADGLTPQIAAARLGIAPASLVELLTALEGRKQLVRLSNTDKSLIHKNRREYLCQRLTQRCQLEVDRRQPCRAIERATLLHACRRFASPRILEATIDYLMESGRLARIGDKVGPPGQRAALSKARQKLLADIVEKIRGAGPCPPLVAELATAMNQTVKEIDLLARIAVEEESLVRVGDGLFYSPVSLADMESRLTARLRSGTPAAVSEIRDLLGLSRKYAIPLCEFFDATKVTVRQGDCRILGLKAATANAAG